MDLNVLKMCVEVSVIVLGVLPLTTAVTEPSCSNS
jgi:hypothetical protein